MLVQVRVIRDVSYVYLYGKDCTVCVVAAQLLLADYCQIVCYFISVLTDDLLKDAMRRFIRVLSQPSHMDARPKLKVVVADIIAGRGEWMVCCVFPCIATYSLGCTVVFGLSAHVHLNSRAKKCVLVANME